MAERHDDADPGRRRFLGRLGIGVAGLAALAAAVPILGVLIRPARPQGPLWRDVGPLEDFPPGSTRKVVYPTPNPDPWGGFAVRNAAWVRRETDGRLLAFSIYCTHTGCPVSWEAEAGLFICPCHGGVFDREGEVSAGPPSRPLDRTPVRVRAGRVEIEAVDVPTPA